MTTAWAHLPNARYIDLVISSLMSHPDIWNAARIATKKYDAGDAAWFSIWDTIKDSPWAPVFISALNFVTMKGLCCSADRSSGWSAARNTVAALIAYDDSAKYLDMTSDHLKMWATLSEDPAAVLLLPAVIAFEQIKELELA